MDNIQNENFYNKVIELFQNAKKKLFQESFMLNPVTRSYQPNV